SGTPLVRPGGGNIGNDEVPSPRATKTLVELAVKDKGLPVNARTCPASLDTTFEPSENGGGGASGGTPPSPATPKAPKLGFLTCRVDIKPIPPVERTNGAGSARNNKPW